ncbi:ribose 5-phosphate isomerase B [Hydrogenivirga caldilitoris]|uniref:Ribose 5-phosphate isomerase B n=1 Tax=Hydrogenivirga caldilitoris TaxID=246264 RepID=A0A497XS93_9AQUI|nr:ribose 5-phosphate isomerase B [Hydrogenivirga caldilitoris]RLJ69793.1 ribose 5-phosphate isomerase B [Hydrogenivirga caldilitoris]
MRIALGSDHAGFPLKEKIKEFLLEKGHEVVDFGTTSVESTHYPLFAKEVSLAVQNGKADRGILVCGTGIGMSITANKFKGIRAALCMNEYMARMSRLHNDANVLCLGDRVVGEDLALAIVETWLETPFEGGRHAKRVELIAEIEKEYL